MSLLLEPRGRSCAGVLQRPVSGVNYVCRYDFMIVAEQTGLKERKLDVVNAAEFPLKMSTGESASLFRDGTRAL